MYTDIFGKKYCGFMVDVMKEERRNVVVGTTITIDHQADKRNCREVRVGPEKVGGERLTVRPKIKDIGPCWLGDNTS